MKRPWQIWFLYAVGLAGVATAFAWLTVKALELDRAESLARRQAEQEEHISKALWIMDARLTPLLAAEAARPEFFYHPLYSLEPAGKRPAGKGEPEQRELSPLLANKPYYVLLHFEVRPDGCVVSPQSPTGSDNAWALKNGASLEVVNSSAALLAQLAPALSHEKLLAQLPQYVLPSEMPPNSGQQQVAGIQNPLIANNYDYAQNEGQPGVQQLRQQVERPSQQPNQPPSVVNPPAQQPALPQEDSQQVAQQQGNQIGQSFNNSRLAYNGASDGNRAQRQGKGGNDLINREANLQAAVQQSAIEQRGNFRNVQPAVRVVEGASRLLWMDSRLLLARRVQIGEQTVVQGCWLDWQQLQAMLRAEVADLLPEVELTPLRPDSQPPLLSRVLATIPVQLTVPPPLLPPVAWTPIRVSLVVVWLCLVVTALAAAMMLHSVVALSERRGAFVSAVTHELRTPLTTFRMYAEMLSAGMVPEAAQRQQYLETLRVEADRLAHLVENVLQYARLERGRPGGRREQVSLAGLLDRCQSRLADRAAQAEMKFAVELTPEQSELTLATDSAAVEQILFNLVDNACKYAVAAAEKRIHLSFDVQPRRVQLRVRDHGPGISSAGRKRLFQPFSKSVHEAANSAPGVGLGLALSRRLAADLGGRLELQSPAGGGCEFVLTLPRS